jgi:hypothetical protein
MMRSQPSRRVLRHQSVAPTDLHPQWCDCAMCEPLAPSIEQPLSLDAIVLRIMAGTGIGYAFCWILGL